MIVTFKIKQMIDKQFMQLNDKLEKFFTKPKNFTEHFDISDDLQIDTENEYFKLTSI